MTTHVDDVISYGWHSKIPHDAYEHKYEVDGIAVGDVRVRNCPRLLRQVHIDLYLRNDRPENVGYRQPHIHIDIPGKPLF